MIVQLLQPPVIPEPSPPMPREFVEIPEIPPPLEFPESNDRQTYHKSYYQNNKDKYKTEYRQIKYCDLCEKEFINITRHKTTKLHKLLVSKSITPKAEQQTFHNVRKEKVQSSIKTQEIVLEVVKPFKPFTKDEYKKMLEQTDIVPASYKNYPFSNDPIWTLLENAIDILNYFEKRSNEVKTSSQIQHLYNLFALFFKLNNIHHYISNEDELQILKNIFAPIKTKKNLVSKKKIVS